jgi:hypothetical protein
VVRLVTARTPTLRIVQILENCAFVGLLVSLALDWYHESRLDESIIADPAAKAEWLRWDHLYDRIGLIFLVLMVALKIVYWVGDYMYDRRVIALDKG